MSERTRRAAVAVSLWLVLWLPFAVSGDPGATATVSSEPGATAVEDVAQWVGPWLVALAVIAGVAVWARAALISRFSDGRWFAIAAAPLAFVILSALGFLGLRGWSIALFPIWLGIVFALAAVVSWWLERKRSASQTPSAQPVEV